jgi:class 3 adenylate cyclase
MSNLYVYDWHWQLQASPERLWELIADTNRLNQVTGMPKVQFERRQAPEGFVSLFAHAQVGRWFALDWQEEPFDWVRPSTHRVKRVFQRSRFFPFKSLENFFTLTPSQGGTDLNFKLTLEGNGLIGRLFIPGIAKNVHASFERAFRQMDAYLAGEAQRAFETPLIELDETARQRLARLMEELRGRNHPPALLDSFQRHLYAAPSEELTRMRPFAYADRWGQDRYSTLALFLHAASLGILDLSWDVLCPDCRGAGHKSRALSDLPETVHCPSCNIDYQAYFDRSIEATFNLNPQIFPVERVDYCIGGPHAAPHVLVQQVLQPEETRTLCLSLERGAYRLRIPSLGPQGVRTPASVLAPLPGQPWLMVMDEGPQASQVDISPSDVQVSETVLGCGELTLTLHNHTDAVQFFILEDGRWSEHIATAADVTALQAFRDLFSAEALRPGYSIQIQNMVVLFTDLKDSTRLYQRVGDASAFGRVIDHFDLLREVVQATHGSVVKTIGDAVMAVFRDPADGLRAAFQMHQAIDAYNRQSGREPLCLKIGLHQGACIAVTLNERLDYFGSTVNLAARLESQSQGGDVVVSQALVDDPAVKSFLSHSHAQIQRLNVHLKGLEGEYILYRLQPDLVAI